ncbi:hypothetical protein ISG33_13895 [Glaciecola sp. MH2013]|uniref:hypothetical protein n=1 Tax=Glaciecola sp. MH2013 TaxID=2785524 RepID=UPI00189FD816|nr:hypothetical protein [Glaciecola sp. MH2013]MBF7074494.1 hypothetical protein [Glaciecola sp. MH2013]
MKFLLFFVVLLFSGISIACTCAAPSIEESFKNADFVYIGQIESAKLSDSTEVTNYLTIIKEYKGVRDTDVVMSRVSKSSCSSPAGVGYEYLVFGKNNSTPILESCGQTRVIFYGKKALLDKLDKLVRTAELELSTKQDDS